MAELTVIVRKGTKEIAKGTVPDLDGKTSVSPEEAAKTTFKLTAGGADTDFKTLKAEKGVTFSLKDSIGEEKITISSWDGMLTAFKEFEAGPKNIVKITIPSKTEIQKLTGKGKDAKDHKLSPLIEYERQEILVTIPIPEGYDFHKFTPEIAKLVMKELEEHHPDQDFVKALKNAAQIWGLGSKIGVKFGFATTDMTKVYGQSRLEAAKAETETDDEVHTDDPAFKGYNFRTVYESTHAALATARKLEMRILELIEEILTMLAVGDPDLLAILVDLEAALDMVQASKTGVKAAEKKAHLRKQIQALRDEQLKEQELGRKAIAAKDQAGYAGHEAKSQKLNYLIQDAEALKQIMDEVPQIHMRSAEAAKNTADRIRYSRDRSSQR